jgi:hypothetical protein
MEHLQLVTLAYLLYDGLLRRSKSNVVFALRAVAYTCIVCGPTSFTLAWWLPDFAPSYFLISGMVCLLVFFVLTLVCAGMVAREKQKE